MPQPLVGLGAIGYASSLHVVVTLPPEYRGVSQTFGTQMLQITVVMYLSCLRHSLQQLGLSSEGSKRP